MIGPSSTEFISLATLKRALREAIAPRRPRPSGNPHTSRTVPFALSALAVAGSAAPTPVNVGGQVVALSSSSHASAKLEIAFDNIPSKTESTQGPCFWYPLTPGNKVRKPDGSPFECFFARLAANTPVTSNLAIFLIDPDELGETFVEAPRAGNVNAGGSLDTKMIAQNLAGTDVNVVADDSGALATAGWTGAAFVRFLASAAGRLGVNLITGQDGVAAGAGVLGATVQRVTIATDDGARTDLDTLAGAVTAARAKVNPIVGQAGVEANRGIATALTQRVTIATDDSVPSAPTLVQGLATGDTLVEIPDTATNGATFVSLIAANATKAHVPTTVTYSNEDTIAHVFLLMRNGGAGTVIQRHVIPAGGSFTLDLRGDVRTGVNESLGVKLGEAIGTVQPHVSGAAVTR